MSRTRIVAVDDDRRILRMIKRSCERIGCEVHSVTDAGFFESSFRAFEPSLVFLDLNMRDIDGVELLRFMAEERRGTSVIVTSGVDGRLMGAAHALGLSLGLDMLDPLRKPMMHADVQTRLKAFQERPAHEPVRQIGQGRLRDAIDQGLVDVCYQPMVNLASGEVVCVEALARLRQPGARLLVPEQFIPVAERSGLIDDLTFCVLERALSDLCAWGDRAANLQVSVNLSPGLLADAALPDRVGAVLDRHRVPARRLVIEVTETRAPDDRQRMADTLARLRASGVHLALDDFGTGFCSLGHLYEFPFETLKLDKKFAMRAEVDAESAAMIRSSLDLARSVGLSVVVEGIQSEDTLRWLARLGCDTGQGFHISPPLSAAAFRDWLDRPDPWTPIAGTALEVDRIAG